MEGRHGGGRRSGQARGPRRRGRHRLDRAHAPRSAGALRPGRGARAASVARSRSSASCLAETVPVLLVDFEHLMGYLDEVVDACEPDEDPRDMKGWYRSKLLEDDGAIDRIQRNLRDKASACLAATQRRANPWLPRSATSNSARTRCATRHSTKRTCRSGVVPLRAHAGRCWQRAREASWPIVGAARPPRCPRNSWARLVRAMGYGLAVFLAAQHRADVRATA